MTSGELTDPIRADPQPEWLRWVQRALLLALFAIVARHAFMPGVTRVPPTLLLLVLMGPLSTVLIGNAIGHVAFALSLATQLGFWLTHPSDFLPELALRSNLLIVTGVAHLFVIGYAATFRRLQQQHHEQEQRIERRMAERVELTRAVSADLRRSVAGLGECLARERLDATELAAVQLELERTMQHARKTLHERAEPEIQIASVLPDLRRKMTRWLFIFSVGIVSITLVRVLFFVHGPIAPTVAVLTTHFVLWIASELAPDSRRQLVAGLTGASLLAIVASFFYWGFDEPPPNLPFLMTFSYSGFLIGGSAVMLGILAVSVAAIAALALAGAASTVWGALILSAAVVVTLLLKLCWYLLERRVLSVLEGAYERAAQLKQLDAFRSRIAGTLFHDVANLVQVIGMTCKLGERYGFQLDDRDTLLRFHERLGALVRAALELLEHGEIASRDRIVRAQLAPMFDELQQLFRFRLESKRQTLAIEADPQLSVRTVPELLRDSVLANLISNAIKFSPEGSTIALEAKQEGGNAHVVVRDRGPGFPEALIARISAGERIQSTSGTAGEEGLGLGLTLAAEHLRRIGGDLCLGATDAGSGEAKVCVPLA